MQLYSEGNNYKLFQGDMLDLLEVIDENSIDAVLTDPPYELNFMGKGWDNSGIAFQKETWEKCLKVLKPGGYLLAFGGSRTFHRIACAIEDAGFEIRDCIMRIFGQGFPKSMNLGHKIEGYKGWGTALKPSYESIIVARKPLEGSCTDNVIKYGVGGINIDECRVGTEERTQFSGRSQSKSTVYSEFPQENAHYETVQGRFPANTILTYSDEDKEEVCGNMPNSKGKGHTPKSNISSNSIFGTNRITEQEEKYFEDSGSVSRYFYCAKASKRDRDEGLDEMETKSHAEINGRKEGSAGAERAYGGGTNPYLSVSSPRKNVHPCVKPTSLMQYLVRLVTPNGGTVLDPFNGSGSTGKAVMYENKDRNKGYKYIGIELTEEYLPISKARIEYVINETNKGLFNTNEKQDEMV